MAIKGMIGAVYESDAAPVSENIALIFDWTLEVQHSKEFTYGPELHGIPTGWHVKAEAYWASEKIPKGQALVRLFIGQGDDRRCLSGLVELAGLKKTEGICETKLRLQGVGQIRQEA